MSQKPLSAAVPALLAATMAVSMWGTMSQQAMAQSTPTNLTYDARRGVFSFAGGIEHALPAVVKVTTLGAERSSASEGPKALQGGSGVIIDAANGIVITNHHVIEGGRTFTIDLIDGRLFDAELVGADKATDIAVLKVRASGLSQVQRVDSDTLRSGDLAFAVGYPLGLDQTLTMGVVSGLNRSGMGDAIEDYIQTDAAVNSGNSGGPLLDSRGRLIGINTSILSGGFGGGNDGIAFAVPTRIMDFVVKQLIEKGEVERGQIGLTVGSLTAARARELGLNIVRGAVVHDVLPGSSAEQAGLRRGDVVTRLENRPVANGGSVVAGVGIVTPGTSLPLSYLRNGRETSTSVTVQPPLKGQALLGATQAMARGLTVQRVKDGLQIVVVEAGTHAATAELKAGDIITSINGRAVGDLSGFISALQGASVADLAVQRNGEALEVQLGG